LSSRLQPSRKHGPMPRASEGCSNAAPLRSSPRFGIECSGTSCNSSQAQVVRSPQTGCGRGWSSPQHWRTYQQWRLIDINSRAHRTVLATAEKPICRLIPTVQLKVDPARPASVGLGGCAGPDYRFAAASACSVRHFATAPWDCARQCSMDVNWLLESFLRRATLGQLNDI